jgi:hypothetical protein
MVNREDRNSGFGIIGIFITIIVITIIGGVSWIFYGNFVKKSPPAVSTQSSNSTTSPSSTPDPYSGWLQYCSKQEKSCFKYPNTWATKDVSSVDPNGDGISLTSPNGTILWFQSAVSGIGGTCNSDTDPHVFIDKVIAEPHVSNLYIVETKYGNTGSVIHIGLVNGVDDHAPQTGDIGYCIHFTTFKSRHDPSIDAWFEINGNSNTYLKPVDIPAVELILKSYTY